MCIRDSHIAKRLSIPCAVISAPVHVQDFPARYAPQMGFEGANVIFDTWVQPLMMGLEEHLLTMFRGDFEFHDQAAPSHLGTTSPAATTPAAAAVQAGGAPAEPALVAPASATSSAAQPAGWAPEAERELNKIPFFVRGKARRNTERDVYKRQALPGDRREPAHRRRSPRMAHRRRLRHPRACCCRLLYWPRCSPRHS